jgi:UDP-glucose 4-epimerase
MRHKDSFIPRLMRAALEGGDVEVYGDGLQRRDLVHVDDVARAFAAAVLGWPSGPVIIGSGTSHTVLDLVEAARQATGRPIAAEQVPAKPGEMPAVVVDVSRAAGLGWSPEVTLVDGVRTAWADFASSATS